MYKQSKDGFHFIGVVVVCLTVITLAITAFSMYFCKKKNEEKEIEDYLDNAIQ